MLKKVLINIFDYLQKLSSESKEAELQAQWQKKATIAMSATIASEAILENALNDPSRIIIGNKCLIKGYLLVFNHGGRIEIGEDCFIGPGSRVWSAKSIEIGNRVLIAHNVNIHDNNSHPMDSRKRHEDFCHILKSGFQSENSLNEKPILIKDDAWIGYNSIIMKGVTIGKGVIVGAGSFVKEDIPDYAVVVGNPARVIKYTT